MNIRLRIESLLIYLFVCIVIGLTFLLTLNIQINIQKNIIYFFILLSVSLLILFISNYLFDEINNPINLFFIGWLLPLTLSQLHVSKLQENFSPKTWILLISTTIAFLIPTFINGINLKSRVNKNLIKKKRIYNVGNLYKPIISIGLSIIFVMIINWVFLGGIPIFAGESNISHLDNTKFTSYAIFFAPYLSGIATFYLSLNGKKFRKLMWIFILLPYIYSILQMLRSFMLATIFSQISFIYLSYRIKGLEAYSITRKLFKYILIGVTLLIFAMVILGNLRLQSMTGSTKLGKNFFSHALGFYINNDAFAWLYSYYVMGFDNLNYFINNYSGPFMYGYNVLLPIIGPLQIKNFWPVDPHYIDSIIPRLWGNAVGTYLREIYLDGGLVYSFIIVLFISIVINYIYLKSVIRGINLSWFSMYVVISYGVLYMFFNSGAILQPNVILYMFIIYYITSKYIKLEVSNENSDKCFDY